MAVTLQQRDTGMLLDKTGMSCWYSKARLRVASSNQSTTPNNVYVGQDSVPFWYMQCLAGRSHWPPNMSDEVSKRAKQGKSKRGFDGSEWTERESEWTEREYKRRRNDALRHARVQKTQGIQ